MWLDWLLLWFWLRGGSSETPDRGARMSRPNLRSRNHIDVLRASSKVERLAADGWHAQDSPADSGVLDGVLVEGYIRMTLLRLESRSSLFSRTS
jgi:hypothetical protein